MCVLPIKNIRSYRHILVFWIGIGVSFSIPPPELKGQHTDYLNTHDIS